MIGSKSQEDWRSAVLMARAKDPNLSFGRASERVFLDAWEDDLGLDGMAEPAPAGALLAQRLPLLLRPAPSLPCSTPACRSEEAQAGQHGAARPAHDPDRRVRQGKGWFAPAPVHRFTPGEDRKDWCQQCDRRVGAGEVAACKDRFCSFQRNA
jgi:hypothetical protein